MYWRYVFGFAVSLAAWYFLREEDVAEIAEQDVVLGNTSVTPHVKDYRHGRGLFGRHKGVYSWGNR